MEARELAVGGAWAFTPDLHRDDRGLFVSPFEEREFRPLFPVAQVSTSVSRDGVARGVHYARTRPGCAKYVHCARGRVLDFVVDLRVGSPTFGQWDSVELADFRAVYLPAGLGHAFVALEPDSTVCYLLSRGYEPADELAVSLLDPELNLPIPAGAVLSRRDRDAPTLAEALADGLLPHY
ncbi:MULTISPECIES: dTDP-4-dehydrorhamnose 3,5-epimerase family protein [Actinokineospora]|uniref:dTDP-4-dehydrorhamnose 3,5-epimerase n=1 Tax=Actinokineospora fastidiosa TaxID=1816 RepID=A0A918L6U7_9PSEU|nr:MULTISPECIES: dTDP-4-dehydrorhamnose 3,5-epimerase [Actinokineospora]UVS76700.1 dTDP-4-dehydrorhamnose 3,5-epimerase [Actinokineospora sp. UTMC 2448]GGS16378.1 dTDP-4-dehydrorhamnose 3,5-epimerase [Actinokineospora fastidiosa]